jgi:uncharacterized membrane protein
LKITTEPTINPTDRTKETINGIIKVDASTDLLIKPIFPEAKNKGLYSLNFGTILIINMVPTPTTVNNKDPYPPLTITPKNITMVIKRLPNIQRQAPAKTKFSNPLSFQKYAVYP